jgi:hypothetical protein
MPVTRLRISSACRSRGKAEALGLSFGSEKRFGIAGIQELEIPPCSEFKEISVVLTGGTPEVGTTIG